MERELCHNCDTKPAQLAKIDFIDRKGLLIPCKLRKPKKRPGNPAYKLIRQYLF